MNTNSLDSYIEGDITDIATRLYDDLVTTGYSLLGSDVERIIIDVCRDYIAWAGKLRAFELDDKDDTLPLMLDGSVKLHNDEWSIMLPVVKARCDIMQSKRMEGAQNLGVQPVGVSSSEALQSHREAMLDMKKEAFNSQPFSLDLTDDKKNQAINGISSIEINFGGWP